MTSGGKKSGREKEKATAAEINLYFQALWTTVISYHFEMGCFRRYPFLRHKEEHVFLK